MKRKKMSIRSYGLAFGLAFCAWCCPANGQSTQAMLEQIGALKAFIAAAERGYQIAENGLHTIKDIKNGEFNLHMVFYSSLLTVNPAVRNMPQVSDAIGLEQAMVLQFSNAMNGYRQSGGFSAGDLDYIGKVSENLTNRGSEDINALDDLVTDGRLEMTDGERMRRIEGIEEDVRARYGFVQEFLQRAGLLVAERQKESKSLNMIKGLYGMP
jgi:hypothetical protein